MDDRAVFTLPDPPPAPIENIKKLQRRNLNIFNLPGQTAQHQPIRCEVAVSQHQVLAAGDLVYHIHLRLYFAMKYFSLNLLPSQNVSEQVLLEAIADIMLKNSDI